MVLYPLFTPTYLMVAFCGLFSKYLMPLPAQYWWYAIGGTAFFTFLVPLVVLIVMKLQGRIASINPGGGGVRPAGLLRLFFLFRLLLLCSANILMP